MKPRLNNDLLTVPSTPTDPTMPNSCSRCGSSNMTYSWSAGNVRYVICLECGLHNHQPIKIINRPDISGIPEDQIPF